MLDSTEIKKRIQAGECSTDLICGKALFWAAGRDLETFKWYFDKKHLGTMNQFSWNYITKYAVKHKTNVVDFLKENELYDDTPILKEPSNITGIRYAHFKSKKLPKLRELLESEDTVLTTEDVCFLALNCGLHGSLATLKYLYEKIESMRPLIAVNAIRGAVCSYFPDIIRWVEEIFGRSIFKMKIENDFIIFCPHEILRAALLERNAERQNVSKK